VGREAHEELVAKIAREGMEWSLTFWRKEDAVAFLFRCVRVLCCGCGGTWSLFMSISIRFFGQMLTLYFRLVPRECEGDERRSK
jgi:hypothetical protein